MGSQLNTFNCETPELMNIIPKILIVHRVRNIALTDAGIDG